ncbi:GyrI-like domain-containing protein [Aestuariimicrobium soli]|uniref:GyrI-like domain-containing protein n=1 Tax=Aestuariimicrobium soli TaxID=2035834 RepID=UPI003EBEBD4B
MPAKTDLKRTLPDYTAPASDFEMVTVPPRRYLAVTGSGDPNVAPEYADALATLYPAAYALKFASKAAGRDYVVPPLEALWWADDLSVFTTARDKSAWQWTVLNLVPDWLSSDLVSDVLEHVRTTKRPPLMDRLRLEPIDEGLCVQTLHLGPFDDEAPVLDRLHHEFVPAHDLRLTGRHHEIYFSDPRRVAPEKLRTILRQPVLRIGGAGTNPAPQDV